MKAETQATFMPARSVLLQRKCACGGASGFTGECEECDKKRLTMQQKAARQTETDDAPSIVQDVLRSPGEPLDAATRNLMESQLGHNFSRVSVGAFQPRHSELAIGAAGDRYEQEADASAARPNSALITNGDSYADFSRVRIHTDSRAAESARAVGAHAYTAGHHIVFDAGKYTPQTHEGRALIAHELTHVQQQTAGAPGVLQRQPKAGDEKKEEKKKEEPTAKFTGCDKDRLAVVQDAIKKAEALATRAVQAFEREYPLSYESAAMTAHFGSIGSDQKSKIIERYKHVIANLNSKTYTCAKDNKRVREGNEVSDLCGQAMCPGNTITLFPVFGSETCPAGPVLLHEAIHNAGACDDINKGGNYPPSSSEDNAYSYEYFALDVTAGYKTPDLKKRNPTAPK
ncbi:MAG: DUF4157 domain-containing protein [Blastocatellia bacterium]